jgi:hypothetical protein
VGCLSCATSLFYFHLIYTYMQEVNGMAGVSSIHGGS